MVEYDNREMDYRSPRSSGGKLYYRPTSYSYRDYVDVLSARNPCLLNLASFLASPKTARGSPQVTALDFQDGISHPVARHLPDVDSLPQELWRMEAKPEDVYGSHSLQGRLLIIEDLTADVIELLGSSLDIDPLFFALHLHTTQRNDMRSQTPDEATLPSRTVSQNYMNTTYHRPLVSDEKPPAVDKLVREMTVDRKLVFIRSTPIGLAQHCVSVIKVQQKSDLWIAVILADPAITDTYYPTGGKDNPSQKVHLPLRPYLGHYEDFLSPPKYSSSSWTRLDDSPRGGMASELLHYWARSTPSSFNSKSPTLESLAYYPLKIVAAEWVKYVAVMQHCIKMYEYRGDQLPDLDHFNMDLRELQGWRRRSMLSQQKVRSIARQLKTRNETEGRSDPALLIEDFEVISNNIEIAGKRLEHMLPVVTSLVQIIDARQSFAETTNISRLTILALIFVPLTFVASLFSMNEDNGPGGPEFWIYFAVAVPITLLVFLVARPPTGVVVDLLVCFKSTRQTWMARPKTSPKSTSKGPSEA